MSEFKYRCTNIDCGHKANITANITEEQFYNTMKGAGYKVYNHSGKNLLFCPVCNNEMITEKEMYERMR